jgi:hypothetical protein
MWNGPHFGHFESAKGGRLDGNNVLDTQKLFEILETQGD